MDEMQITSAQYIALDGVVGSIKATIDGQEIFVPLNASGNRHFIAIQKAVSDGQLTIQEASE